MTRPMCSLCGVSFPRPVTVKEMADWPRGKTYFMICRDFGVNPSYIARWWVKSLRNADPHITNQHVLTNMVHLFDTDAHAHITALDAVNAHAVEHAK